MTEIQDMTVEQCRAEAQGLLDSTDGDLAGPAAERFQALTRRAELLRQRQAQRAAEAGDMVRRLRDGDPGFALEGPGGMRRIDGTPLPGYAAPSHYGDEDRPPVDRQRDTALRTVDRSHKDGLLTAGGAEVVERLVGSGPAPARSWAARWVTETGSQHYRNAFCKMLADPTRGHLQWDAREQESWQRVTALQHEQRAMSLTDVGGGFLVPFELDASVLLSSDGSNNPLMRISRVITTVSDTWHGVTSEGVTAEWLPEASEAADASPTLTQPAIPSYKASVFVPFSVELQGDATTLMQELGRLLQDGADQLLATAFTTGSGISQPSGIVSTLADVPASVVSGDGSEVLAASDIYKVQNALPPRFQPRASWTANLAILNLIRQFETTNGALKFPELAANPPMLLGRNVYENSNMDGTINAAATESNHVLLYGDFSQFAITLRTGSSLELIPHLVGANRRPRGERGAWLWLRVGSGVLVDNAFRVLRVSTTA
ncbi:major capsid protein [Mycobacterium persicum]|uniref:Major capsid protein n=2 Tax=Mycobacterium persicum TaxID=1487726 RepID=A0A8E2LQZ7_9MYCO|nr:phage major capsid protein [Mycobacterium persicum]ORB39764.1 major capsid protein [Mycobacterium persicum]ORB97789.1 major capsid protein [Mycobacterium persicum]ORC09858.1 major capsid protein [Mycobacterium persicum]